VILYNPLVKNVTVLKKRFIRGGTRRVKRAKLYYLYERDPQLYTVSYK
jgi:ribosomal protein L19